MSVDRRLVDTVTHYKDGETITWQRCLLCHRRAHDDQDLVDEIEGRARMATARAGTGRELSVLDRVSLALCPTPTVLGPNGYRQRSDNSTYHNTPGQRPAS
ncbi:MAG: hypothetical protein ACXIVQ_12140 [Acidimicrobiales bacterium]